MDFFLNVMYVCDADDAAPAEKAELLETDAFAGAKLLGCVALFRKEKGRTEETVRFSVPGSEKALRIHVAGLASGTWQIYANGKGLGAKTVSAEGGMLFFTGPAGMYELTMEK